MIDKNGYAPSIMQNKRECFISGDTGTLARHEIYFGTANRKKSKAYGFWVYLKPELHNMSNIGVHYNKRLDDYLKKECQRKFEALGHSREEFVKIIGRNYL